MATKINKNLENSFVFAPNEMQQAAFEGAKQKIIYTYPQTGEN